MINSKEFNQKSNKKNEIKKIIQNKKNLSVDSLYERKMFFYKKKKIFLRMFMKFLKIILIIS